MKPQRRIPVAGPSITQAEIDAVTDAVRSGWYDAAGRFQARFEQAFFAHTGRRFAVSVPSCTAALHLALAGLGIGRGDEVIVPEITWIATAAPIAYVGADIVFADVDARTLCLSVDAVADCITDRTKAIIAVDLYGHMPDWSALTALADARGIPLIEDAAQAIGSTFQDRPAGSFGTASAFSFHGSKTLTTGEGGMLVTDDPDLHARVLSLRDHGRAPGDVSFVNQEVGFKYRMSAMQAALGHAQLARLPDLVATKRRIFRWYHDRLCDVGGLRLNAESPAVFDSQWMSTVFWDADYGFDKNGLIAALAEHGIDTRPVFYPLSSLPAFRQSPQAERARARNRRCGPATQRAINLPSPLDLTEEEADHIAASLRACLASAAQRGRSGTTPGTTPGIASGLADSPDRHSQIGRDIVTLCDAPTMK